MTAATLSNAQSALITAQAAISMQTTRAAEAVKANAIEVKESALEAGRAAVSETKAQGGQLVISLTALAPIVMILLFMLIFNHVNFMAVARLLPMCALFIIGFAVLSVFNPGHTRTEP